MIWNKNITENKNTKRDENKTFKTVSKLISDQNRCNTAQN